MKNRRNMGNIQMFTTIVIRALAVSFFMTALIELAIIVTDFLLVKAEIYRRSEISFVPRIMYASFAIITAAYLFYQAKPLIQFIIDGVAEDGIVQEPPQNEGAQRTD